MAAQAGIGRRTAAEAGDALLDAQRRYLEAWRDASQIMIDAAQAVARRQAELAEENLRELFEPAGEARDPSGEAPGDRLDRVHGFYQRALGGFQELSGIMLQAQSDAVRALAGGVAAGTEAERKAA